MIAVTSSKQWIHFFRSERCPPTSNNLKNTMMISIINYLITLSYNYQHLSFIKQDHMDKSITLIIQILSIIISIAYFYYLLDFYRFNYYHLSVQSCKYFQLSVCHYYYYYFILILLHNYYHLSLIIIFYYLSA